MTSGERKSPGRSVLSDVPPPTVIDPSVALEGPPVSPAGRIRLYSPDEWEEFIREWATALPQTYVQIKRLGGAGDKGAESPPRRFTSTAMPPVQRWLPMRRSDVASSSVLSNS